MDEKQIEWRKPSQTWSELSKKERKRLAKEQRREESKVQERRGKIVKIAVISAIVLVVVIAVIWGGKKGVEEYSGPIPGKEVPLLGRNHVPVGTKVKYNSNPPTSGNHYADWIKSGVYDKEVEDGHLVHSLEHGYVIISHNCSGENPKSPLRPRSEASEIRNPKQATESAKTDKECLNFVDKLKDRVEKDAQKLILVPRPALDTNFALTAWGRIDKFKAEEANMDRVNNFIDSLRNHGPEQTME